MRLSQAAARACTMPASGGLRVVSHAARRNLASRVPSRVTRHRGVCTRSTRVRGAPKLASVAKRSIEPVTETSGMDVRGKTVLVVGLGCVPVASSQARFSKRPTQPPRRHDARMFIGTSSRRDVGARKTSRSRFTFAPPEAFADENPPSTPPSARAGRAASRRRVWPSSSARTWWARTPTRKRGGWRRTPTRRRRRRRRAPESSFGRTWARTRRTRGALLRRMSSSCPPASP